MHTSMFGPSSTSLKGKNIISIPIRDAKKELTVTKNLFADANFVTIDTSTIRKWQLYLVLHIWSISYLQALSEDDRR